MLKPIELFPFKQKDIEHLETYEPDLRLIFVILRVH